ncbi:MAG: DNA invertase Pin-like site-specific DNA recombinase, partial [Flavobacteriales bacterium]
RTSTKRQDLGLEAQQNIITNFLNEYDIVLYSFSEQESGSKKNRLELNKAIQACKDSKAVLLIAKLDRLSRSVSFISTLLDSDIEIVVADMPNANKFTLHILASVAQQELDSLHKRTTDALNVIKNNIKRNGFHISKVGNRITKLGNGSSISEQNRLLGQQAIRAKKHNNPNLIKAKAFASVLKKAGSNLTEITLQLNNNGFKTSQGKRFHLMSTRRLFELENAC